MILGYHLTWTAYGWWFPNDPRGSWSKEVWVPQVRDLGEAHFGRRPVQPTSQALRAWLAKAQPNLKHQPVILDGPTARAAATGVRDQVARHGYRVWALCVMPDHAHVVVGRHAHSPPRIAAGLKAEASKHVRTHLGLTRSRAPEDFHQRRRDRVPIWTRGYWVRFLNDEAAIRAAIRYVESNPAEWGLPRQRWSFVVPFDPNDASP